MRVVDGIQDGWDGEEKGHLDLWRRQTRLLESQALERLDDQTIDQIFSTVSQAIGEPLYNGICAYLDRAYSGTKPAEERTFDEGVFPDVIEAIKRDLCWAAVEHVLDAHGFFSELLDIYRRGRWACSWDGNYPEGQPVLL